MSPKFASAARSAATGLALMGRRRRSCRLVTAGCNLTVSASSCVMSFNFGVGIALRTTLQQGASTRCSDSAGLGSQWLWNAIMQASLPASKRVGNQASKLSER